MKKKLTDFISVLLALIIVVTMAIPAFASSVFSDDAYATIITASDFQDEEPNAYTRFGNILNIMKNDGLTTPHSMLCGGDYSKIWPDYATPGVAKVKAQYSAVYPDADQDSIICIQGNHDFTSCGFTKTGFYDMGAYCLYVINENDFPWNQFLRPSFAIEKLAKNIENSLNKMIEDGDNRPVIVLTHVPLHHTDRTFSGDNMYSSYIFNVINKAAEKLDIVFLFGHNHSGDYDDYIGGAVNFLRPGDTIRIPTPDEFGEDCYTEEKLNFTYTNCGYVGYSNNGTEDGSTDTLTVGAIQISKNTIRFIRYSEKGMLYSKDILRTAPSTQCSEITEYPETQNSNLYDFMLKIIALFSKVFDI